MQLLAPRSLAVQVSDVSLAPTELVGGASLHEVLFILDPQKYTTSQLLTPCSGSLAYRDELVQEISNLTHLMEAALRPCMAAVAL